MKVKAVIWKPDHTNDVVIVSKRRTNGRTFRHNGAMYFMHPDRFQVTWRSVVGVKQYYSTYYYSQGRFMPWPVPDGSTITDGGMALAERILAVKNGGDEVANTVVRDYPVQTKQEMITGEELAALFNPFFYETLAAMAKDTWDKVLWYAAVFGACGTAYLIFRLHNSGVIG